MSIRAAARNTSSRPDIVLLGAYVFNNVLLMLTAGHRRALRPGDRQGRRRQELLLPGDATRRDGVLRETRRTTRSWRRARSAPSSTISTATISTMAASASSAAPYFGRHVERAADRRRGRCRPERRAGAREWKQATAKWYNRAGSMSAATACNYAHRENYLDLDPTYKDALGRPLIRMTLQFPATTTTRSAQFMSQSAAEIARGDEPDDRHRAALPRRQLQRRAVSVDP